MGESKFTGFYDYKGFTIWDTSEGQWIAEPNWDSIEAVEKVKPYLGRHKTIAAAKKWVREEGIKLREEDYLN